MSQKKNVVFIVDDDFNFIKTTQNFLIENDFEVFHSTDGETAIDLIKEKHFDVLLLDKNLNDMTGLDILRNHIPSNIDPVIIMVTGDPSIITAVEALKLGAHNYISKPFDELELLFKIKKELEVKRLKADNEELHSIVEKGNSFKNIIGSSPYIKNIQETIYQLKNSDVTVLITGETGTGKGMLASAIHYSSNRKNKRFVVINAGCLSEQILESELFGHVKGAFTGAYKDKQGLFLAANGGTVFIDEIGELPLKMQVKFLRILEDKEFEPLGSTQTIKVDVRIIAATNQNLRELIQEKKFREDLFYRLNVLNFDVPPLRERIDDLVPLVNSFIKVHCMKNSCPIKSISNEVLRILSSYPWPGNIRELENCIERMVLLEKGDSLSVKSLPPYVMSSNIANDRGGDDLKHSLETLAEGDKSLEEMEKEYILLLLKKHNGYLTKLVEILEIDRKTLYRKLSKYNIDKNLFK